MPSKTWVEISKKNLLHNVEQFLSLLKPETQFMAVVKSNAYGHGLREIVQILSEKNLSAYCHTSQYGSMRRVWFGVDNVDEAKVVREIAPKSPVLVLGYTPTARLKEAAKLGARITVYNWETLKAVKNVARGFMPRIGGTQGAALRVHVKIETGTTRQGIQENEAVEFVKALKKIRGVEVEGISTHFADSEDTRSEYALNQLARYNSVITRLERAKIRIPVQHMTCTAATMRLPQAHGNLVRVGIGMYGLWPSAEIRQMSTTSNVIPVPRPANGEDPLKRGRGKTGIHDVQSVVDPRCRSGMTNLGINLKPVLTWKTIVAQVKEIKKGTPVGYDLTERVMRNSKIAVLPVGYWDGYDRGLSRIGHVLIGGKRCKILGRVCMNMCMVDITAAGRVNPEDEVVLLGAQGREEVSADEIARNLDTINYEVVTRINPLLSRVII